MKDAIERLRSNLERDPGVSDAGLTQAAVLVCLETWREPTSVLLTRRASHMRLHAGEVAFPGGKCDPADDDHWTTALREAEEEVRLPQQLPRRLGVMPTLVTRTKIEITPCIAELAEPVALVPNPEELDRVFSVPLEFLSDAGALSFDEVEYAGRKRLVPRYDWQGFNIWGVTAAILVRLVNTACDAGLAMDAYWQGGKHDLQSRR